MSTAFEITTEDVAIVLQEHGVDRPDDDLAEDLLSKINVRGVVRAALYGRDLSQQTDYAHQELAVELRRIGVIPPDGDGDGDGGEHFAHMRERVRA